MVTANRGDRIIGTMALALALASVGCPGDEIGSSSSAAGGAGGSQLMCQAGTADCNVDAADGCETDLTDEKANCGRCGRDCLDGGCFQSACEPLVVWSNSQVTSIAIDEERLYWSTATRQVLLADKGSSGGALGFNSGNVTSERDGYLAAGDDDVMYGTDPYLVHVQIGMPGLNLVEPVQVDALAYDGSSVVWWDGAASAVRWLELSGMQTTNLSAPLLGVGQAVAVAGNTAYVADDVSVQQIDLANDTATTLTDQGGTHMQLVGSSLFLLSDEAEPRLLRVALAGGAAEVFFDDAAVTTFAIGDDAAVIATADGLLIKPISGGTARVAYQRPAEKPEWPDHSAVAVAIDAARVYWATPDAAGHDVASVAR